MKSESKKMTKRERKDNLWGWFLVSPVVFKLFVFNTIPALFCLFVSFTDYNMLGEAGSRITKFTLDAYKDVFTSEAFWKSMGNTLFYMLGIPIKLVLGFALAYALNAKFLKGKGLFRVLYYMPAVATAMAIAIVWKWFFNPEGLLNALLGTDIAWLLDPKTVKPALILKGVWGGVGGIMLMYLAGMQNIGEELYESAALDGANAWIKMTKITLPLLGPITLYHIIGGISGGMNAFGENYTMVASEASSTAIWWTYTQFTGGNFPVASAAALLITIVTIVLSIPTYKKLIQQF